MNFGIRRNMVNFCTIESAISLQKQVTISVHFFCKRSTDSRNNIRTINKRSCTRKSHWTFAEIVAKAFFVRQHLGTSKQIAGTVLIKKPGFVSL